MPNPPEGARSEIHLRLHHVTILVSDQDRSRQFYMEKLGFRLVVDVKIEGAGRWVGVSPPDGSAILGLVMPKPGLTLADRIGRETQVVFLTDDVHAKYREWQLRGVPFASPPITPPWGGTFTTFEDPDGNSFGLAGRDEVTRDIETERRAAQEKAEAERRLAQELEIAKAVQARLFPQRLPGMRSLDYAGVCVQARHVGGDYYDFLDLAGGRLGLVVGDISGKGIAAALLMAHLQASLRSQCAIASDYPEDFLKSVNELFRTHSPESAYATLFFATYDDRTQNVRYASCGHPSTLLLRRDGRIDRLASTATALGLFQDWECATAEEVLAPGDTLAIYSDGVTEAFDPEGREFGEERLIEALRRQKDRSAEEAVAAIVDEVRRFGAQEQRDDITLILAKCIRA